MQEVGYAPLARGAGSYLPDMSNHGVHAPEVPSQSVSTLYRPGSTRPVEIRQVSLGEEHVHLVKSMVEGHIRLQKSQCNLCSMQGTRGTAPPNVGYQVCTCAPIEAVVVAKAVVTRMTNAQRRGVSLGDVVGWVRDVAKAGFRLPVPTKPRSLGGRVVDPERRREDKALNRPKASLSDQVKIDGNGGHLRPVAKSSGIEGELVKAIDNTKHSHVVTGKLAPHGIGASGRKAAHTAADRLDSQYGSSAHTVAINPNYKPKTLKWEKTSAYGPGGHTAEAGHGTYIHEPQPHGQHTMTYMPRGQGKEGALHGGSHSSPAAAHASAQAHHLATIGG